ncbi:MAG TPA: hypothetical protein VG962_04150 [Steroidobacteraceae bacterium]|nr:hypothetical protein [Steroidobacteraceae bacterium]
MLAALAFMTGLTGCATGGGNVRTWVDDNTAVAVTAQNRAMVFYRDDFQAGVNIYDFADLGAFEVNQSGVRHQYLCLLLWSTVARTPQQQAQVENAFTSMVVWADDQPLTFKRFTQNRDMVQLSKAVFKHPSSNAQESYYEITPAQLTTLAGAKELRIAPANQAPGEAPYHLWREEHDGLAAVAAQISSTQQKIESTSTAQ